MLSYWGLGFINNEATVTRERFAATVHVKRVYFAMVNVEALRKVPRANIRTMWRGKGIRK